MLARRLRLVLCAAAAVLAVVSTPASAAETLGFVHSEMSLVSEGTVTFRAGEVSVRCNLTISGSFGEEIPLTRGERMGAITSVPSSRCEEGSSVTFLGFSWPLTYQSFTGIRPGGMTGTLMTMAGVSVSIRTLSITCLYRGEVGLNMALRGSGPYEIGAVSTLENRLSLVSGVLCPTTASMSGTFRMEPANEIGEFTVLRMFSSPRMVAIADAPGPNGREVTLTSQLDEVTVRSKRWAEGRTWTDRSEGCVGRTIRLNQSCRVRVIAGAESDTLDLIEGTSVVGLIQVGR